MTPKWDQGSLRSASELGSEAEEDTERDIEVSRIPYPDLPIVSPAELSDDSEDQIETPKARHSVRIITGEESDNVLDVSVSRVKDKKKRIVRTSVNGGLVR